VAVVALGNLLHALLATAVAFAAAAVCRGSASAAIVTLGFTVGTWALDFIAAGRDGWIARLAAFTPAAALRTFEHGELRLAVAAVLAVAAAGGFAVAALGLDPFRRLPRRVALSAAVLAAAIGVAVLASSWRAGWDLAEDRRNSFPRADEAALRAIGEPVRVTVHLAAEDPKLADLERNVLAKLARTLPHLTVTYAADSRSGLFEAAGGHYGEIWYAVGRRKTLLRSTTEPIVLATIYELAGVAPPAAPAGVDDAPYPGYPLAAAPRFAAPLFFVAWPLAAALAFLLVRAPWRFPWKPPASSP
jgi:ABC-2 type transport system permease protein